VNITDLLELFTQISFVVLGAATLVDYLRHRDQTRRDIALMVNSIGLVTALQLFTMITDLEFVWLRTFAVLALISQPYLLLRLVGYLHQVHRFIRLAAISSMTVCFALGIYIVTVETYPPILSILVIAYFVVFNGYAVAAFIKGAFTTSGVVRKRLQFGAVGSGLFALALFIAGVDSVFPILEPVTDPIYRLMAMTSAATYYIGFVPPRWLRRGWQNNQLREYISLIGRPANKRMSEAEHIQYLTHTGRASVSAIGSVIICPSESNVKWDILYTDEIPQAERLEFSTSRYIRESWDERQPGFIRKKAQLTGGDLELLEAVNARSLLIMPIDSGEKRWSLLLTFMKHDSLFPEDDLELLTLLAQQSAIVLENNALIDALQASNEELERRVEERTADLNNAFDEIQLMNTELEDRVAERTAQLTVVNKELESFAYSVSHDLRAPLRALDGFSEALREDYSDRLDGNALHYISRIRGASQRMGQLIDDLLQLSRLSRAELNRVDFDLSETVRLIGQEVQERWPEHRVKFIVQDGLNDNGDVRLIRAAMVNLLENAWKFSSKSQCPRVEFGTTCHNGIQAYFVRDNGAGFDMAYHDKMFGAFQRLHSDYEFEGNGIGLATVQRIARRHGGDVWAEGETGKGATFYFTFSSYGVEE
jgi:signal transduction histidine kinase